MGNRQELDADTLMDFHLDEAVLTDSPLVGHFRHRALLHLFQNPWQAHGVNYLPGWYFHDETGDYHGPFSSAQEAHDLLVVYIKNLNGEP